MPVAVRPTYPLLYLARLATLADGRRWAPNLNGIRATALLCLLCFVLYAPGLAAIPPLDRDEARFAQATRQMLETGDFIRIRFQDEARNKKPVGIHWLQAAAVAAVSTAESSAIWPYRLPSAVAATGAVLLVFAFGTHLLGSRPAGLIAALLAASALGVVVEAHLAKTDAALLAAIVAGQGALGLLYVAAREGRRASWPLALVFWLSESAAILVKGPAGPVIALLTIAALSISDRDVRWIKVLHPLTGGLLTALVVSPWIVAIENATDGAFISDSLLRDLLPKLIGAQESHGAPPGYYAIIGIVSFWPGSLFAVPALVRGWRRRHLPAERFLLAWLIPGWIFFELVPTKLPHYVLPLYPGLALLAGSALAAGFPGCLGTRARYVGYAVNTLWSAVALALAIGLLLLPAWFGGGASIVPFAAAATLVGLAALLLFRNPQSMVVGALMAAALSGLFVLSAGLGVVPRLDALWLSRSAAAMVARHAAPANGAVLSVGYSEPSLVFLLGTTTRLVTAAPNNRQLAGARLALVSDRYDADFRRSLAGRGMNARAVDRVSGVDYSAGGGKLVLTLYELEPG